MKKLIKAIAALPADKVIHSYVCCILTIFIYSIWHKYSLAIEIPLFFGILKELFDFFDYGYKDQHKDLLADATGIGIALMLVSV